MVHVVQNTQILLLSFVLLTASLAKLTVRRPASGEGPASGGPARGGPARGDRDRAAARARHNRQATLGLGVFEGGLGLAMLVSPHPSIRLATAVTFGAATWVVAELRRHGGDERGCGCFGGLSGEPVGRRGVLRAALCTLAAAVALNAPQAGIEVLCDGAAWAGLVFVVELALFAALSPEVPALLEQLGLRSAAVTPCGRRRSPLAETVRTLHRSDAWLRQENALVSAAPLDVWREGCWRFLVFPARVDGRDVEIVFAVSTDARNRTVRSAVVEAEAAQHPAPEVESGAALAFSRRV